MSRKEILVPVALAALTVAFAAVSLLVWASRGDPRLIRHKLKIGALMISLTGAVASGCNEGTVTCYAPAPPKNLVSILAESFVPGQTVAGTIDNSKVSALSFRLLDGWGTEIRRGPVSADDGAFDEDHEEFTFTLPPALDPGVYRLEIHRGEPADITARTSLLWRPVQIAEAGDG